MGRARPRRHGARRRRAAAAAGRLAGPAVPPLLRARDYHAEVSANTPLLQLRILTNCSAATVHNYTTCHEHIEMH